MTENELKGHSGPAFEFKSTLCVVSLEYALEAIKAEREACAKVCADRAKDEPGKLPTPDAYKDEAMMCASYIRARST